MFSNLRIGGLASGMDIDSIVEELMKAHRVPVQKLEQEKQILEWKQEDYREINTSLRSFRDIVFDMKLQSTYLAKKASSSDESVLTATANPSAAPGTYTVNVNQLAEGVSKGSQSALADEKKDDGSTKTLGEQFGLSGTISFELQGSKGSKLFEFDAATDTIYTVVSEINDAGLGIKASYDSTLNRFFLTTESTGSEQEITVLSDPSQFLSDSDLNDGINNALQLNLKTNEVNKGKDAQFEFGDVADLTSSTNSVTVNGISMELKNTGSNVKITVTSNTDAVFASIMDFVEQYNNIMETITGELYEERYSDYLPLTDEQREQLTDSQIEKWEEKARSGLLRNDPVLSSIASRMRLTMSSVVPGLSSGYDTLAEIGITTSSNYMSGKLVVDEEKLKEALQENPEGVMNLFTYSSDNYEEMGIAQRLYEDVNYAMNRIIDKAGSNTDFSLVDNSFIGKRIKQIDERIDTMEERLRQIEDRYWRQFTAMEKAIQQMNSQSMWLMMQFGMYGQQW